MNLRRGTGVTLIVTGAVVTRIRSRLAHIICSNIRHRWAALMGHFVLLGALMSHHCHWSRRKFKCSVPNLRFPPRGVPKPSPGIIEVRMEHTALCRPPELPMSRLAGLVPFRGTRSSGPISMSFLASNLFRQRSFHLVSTSLQYLGITWRRAIVGSYTIWC